MTGKKEKRRESQGNRDPEKEPGQPQGQWLRLPRVTAANSQADEGLGGKQPGPHTGSNCPGCYS